MARLIPMPIFGRSPVPGGRLREVLDIARFQRTDAIAHPERTAVRQLQTDVFSLDCVVELWPSVKAMEKAMRDYDDKYPGHACPIVPLAKCRDWTSLAEPAPV